MDHGPVPALDIDDIEDTAKLFGPVLRLEAQRLPPAREEWRQRGIIVPTDRADGEKPSHPQHPVRLLEGEHRVSQVSPFRLVLENPWPESGPGSTRHARD
ncbi:hypothetical protein GCM10010390_26780 [Streptomyces mordarskii]|uniref:Uncharacterized protein n=1 Tax=Streptomyces mordarskii TaxID=1226758 RepID=A0ABP3MM08_9ACTN